MYRANFLQLSQIIPTFSGFSKLPIHRDGPYGGIYAFPIMGLPSNIKRVWGTTLVTPCPDWARGATRSSIPMMTSVVSDGLWCSSPVRYTWRDGIPISRRHRCKWFTLHRGWLWFLLHAAVVEAHRDLKKASEPLLNEEILQEQETYGFWNVIQLLIRCVATSVYTEEVDSGLLMRTWHFTGRAFPGVERIS